MNDLTQTELRIIWMDMQFYASQSKPMNESPSHRELREKIEDMIENYCEHELVNYCCGCNLENVHCVKCEKDLTQFENQEQV